MLEEHRRSVLSRSQEANQRVNICRSHLLQDSIAAFSRLSFDPASKLKIRFIGEPAVDYGGLMREFFRLIPQALYMAGSLFRVTQHGILPAHNISALSKMTFKFCGKILAVGIVHGAQSPACFTPETAHLLVYGTPAKSNVAETLGAIPDADIQGKLQKVCVCACVCMYMHVHVR